MRWTPVGSPYSWALRTNHHPAMSATAAAMKRLALTKPRQSRRGQAAISSASSTSGSAKARLNFAMSAKANARASPIDRRVVRPERMIAAPIHNRIDPNRPAITSLLIAPLMNKNCGLNATIAAAPAAIAFPCLLVSWSTCALKKRSSAQFDT